MTRSEVVRGRVDTQTKDEAEAILAAMGLSVSDAIRIFFVRTAIDGAPPFDYKQGVEPPTFASRAAERETVRARIDSDTKERAEGVLAALGACASDVIRAMFSRIASDGDLPFDIQGCARRAMKADRAVIPAQKGD